MTAPVNGPIPVLGGRRADHGECGRADEPETVALDIGWCDVIDDDDVHLALGRRRAGADDGDFGSYYEFDLTPAAAARLANLLHAAGRRAYAGTGDRTGRRRRRSRLDGPAVRGLGEEIATTNRKAAQRGHSVEPVPALSQALSVGLRKAAEDGAIASLTSAEERLVFALGLELLKGPQATAEELLALLEWAARSRLEVTMVDGVIEGLLLPSMKDGRPTFKSTISRKRRSN